jgi:acyl-CoA reductase-like NAD-dependent aldehyde dehydrogenase
MTPTRIPIVFAEASAGSLQSEVAMGSARRAQATWRCTPLNQRLAPVRRLRHLIAEKASVLAKAAADGRGRPLSESLVSEVLPLADACFFLERNATKILATRRLGRRGRPIWLNGVHSEIHREPLGVILIIGPGNYPLLLPGVQLVQALVAGNAVLLKPGTGGTAAARQLLELIVRAGFDADLVTLLPESHQATRAAIAAAPDKVLFTGSAAAGETILTALGPHLIPATMELSGCDAVIIRHDADINLAARALKFGLEFNGGATCICPKRIYVVRNVAGQLEDRLARLLPSPNLRPKENLKDPAWMSVAARNRIRSLIADAFRAGAYLIAGAFESNGSIGFPIVLAGVAPSQTVLWEDIFAAVSCIIEVADDNEAILKANESRFALGAAIFTRDEIVGREMASQMNAGVVTINDLIIPTADARVPFGGRRRSGFGVTRGAEGLLDLTVPKVVTISRSRFRPAFDPPTTIDFSLINAYVALAHGRAWKTRAGALFSLIQSIFQRRRLFRKESQ